MAFAGIRGEWATPCRFGIAQVLGNALPIAHLRLARHRVDQFVRKASAHRA